MDGVFLFFLKQKTSYEMRISDWSSDVCSSDLMAASTAALAGESASPDVSYDDHTICAAATAAAERATPIPAQLLHAISLVESGRQDDATQESFAWPWRSDEGRVGTECVSNGRIRGSAYN